jgi:MFS family permease
MIWGLFAMGALTALFIPFFNSAAIVVAISTVVSLANAVFMPAMLAAVAHDTENSGKALGLFDGAASLGWGAGSMVMGVMAKFAVTDIKNDFSMIFIFASAAILLASIVVMVFFHRLKLKRMDGKLSDMIKSTYKISSSNRLLPLLYIAVLLGWFALFWYVPLIKLNLFDDFAGGDWLLYGAAHAAASFTSIFASPFAGRLCDRIGGQRIMMAAMAAYVIYIPAAVFFAQDKLIFIILWMLPIWSFFNVGIYSSGARLSKIEHRAETMGTLESCRDLAGTAAPLGSGRLAGAIGRNQSIVFAPLFLVGAFIAMMMLRRKQAKEEKATLFTGKPISH